VDPRTGVRASRGRVFVIIARSSDLSGGAPEPRDIVPEPRDHVQAIEPITVPFFGLDVDGLTPDEPVVVDSGAAVLGYLYPELGQLPAGTYVIQGFFNTYETNRRADGSAVGALAERGRRRHLVLAGRRLLDTPDNISTKVSPWHMR
jgi:hypothetical protein